MTNNAIVLLTICATLLGGAFGAAILGLVQFLIQRRDKKADKSSVTVKALRYLMLYIIQERAMALLTGGEATLEEKRSLRHWHDLYHDGLGGNGDADLLMEAVDKLPIKTD